MRKKVFLFVCFVLIIFFVWKRFSPTDKYTVAYTTLLGSFCKQVTLMRENKPLWINIFVHGTVGTAFSFLDFYSVKKDNIANSVYKKTVSLLRKNRYFYQDQPIADKGLLRIEPSFDFIKRDDIYYVAYPILKSFDEITNFATGNTEQNVYYLFGWSGYLSQTRRRLEAIRFYNQLAEEVAIYEKLGFQPKIRILAHSHGGNLALNLAGIYHSLKNDKQADEFYKNFEIASYIRPLFDKTLATSVEKEVAIAKKGQKRFSYSPDRSKLFVDELVLLATPIQVETSLFALSPFFGTTYSIYSEGDVIQWMDYVSTINKQSLQRIDGFDFENKAFHQICVTMEKYSDANKKKAPRSGSPAKPPASMWQVILGLKDTSRKSPDPTHKEFWYVVPHDNTPYNFLRPLPIVCLFPLIKILQEKVPTIKDADLEIIKEVDGVLLRLSDKENLESESLTVDETIIEGLRERILPWVKPRDNSKVMRGIMNKLIDIHRSINM